jgi:hypothetical protein
MIEASVTNFLLEEPEGVTPLTPKLSLANDYGLFLFTFSSLDSTSLRSTLILSLLLILSLPVGLFPASFATKILYSFLAPTFLPTNLFQNPVLFFNECNAMKAYWRSGGISPHILDLGSTWRWVVSFMPRPLYPKGKNLWYPLVGLRAGLDAGVRRKIPSPYPECFRILLRIY